MYYKHCTDVSIFQATFFIIIVIYEKLFLLRLVKFLTFLSQQLLNWVFVASRLEVVHNLLLIISIKLACENLNRAFGDFKNMQTVKREKYNAHKNERNNKNKKDRVGKLKHKNTDIVKVSGSSGSFSRYYFFVNCSFVVGFHFSCHSLFIKGYSLSRGRNGGCEGGESEAFSYY